MKKIRITKRAAKICDHTLWAVAVVMAFWLDWRAGVALIAFDAMRVFENIAERIDFNERLTEIMKDDDKGANRVQ